MNEGVRRRRPYLSFRSLIGKVREEGPMYCNLRLLTWIIHERAKIEQPSLPGRAPLDEFRLFDHKRNFGAARIGPKSH
jgi:hypothetical protein